MTNAELAEAALSQRFVIDHPRQAARELEALDAGDAAALLAALPAHALVAVWQRMAADRALALLDALPPAEALRCLREADLQAGTAALAQLDADGREAWLQRLGGEPARELRELLAYPADSAGELMDTRISPLRQGLTVAEGIERLRQTHHKHQRDLRELYVVDDDGRLAGRVEVQDLALAPDGVELADVTRGIVAVVGDLDPREDVVAGLQAHDISSLPVVNSQGRFVGVIRQAELMAAIEEETSLDIQTMVGASPDERALSPPMFAVRKRLPWLQINLLTAFLAAAVVGLFESVIAQVTALAVLLPVVAGQSGNAGAQALAVTMRGLVLREIGLRHWRAVVAKEVLTGFTNGLAVAATTALGVYAWSRSGALVAVIVLAMIVSMVAAGLAGALTPMLLRRFGQDPATASSIILTTVTDIVGFFSFLGIAAAFMPMLA